jgi:hypothetical protein
VTCSHFYSLIHFLFTNQILTLLLFVFSYSFKVRPFSLSKKKVRPFSFIQFICAGPGCLIGKSSRSRKIEHAGTRQRSSPWSALARCSAAGPPSGLGCVAALLVCQLQPRGPRVTVQLTRARCPLCSATRGFAGALARGRKWVAGEGRRGQPD